MYGCLDGRLLAVRFYSRYAEGWETYEINTVRGLPVSYSDRRIRVLDLGITAHFIRGKADASPFVRVLVANW